jgi:hypothetical protein
MGWNEVTAAWVQAASAILAIIAVFLAPIVTTHLQDRRSRRLAAMELIVRLRAWTRHSVVMLRTIENRALAHEPVNDFAIPQLPFTRSFYNVTKMSRPQAHRLLGCLEERELILAEARAAAFFEDFWCALPSFQQRTANLILDIAELIGELSITAGWLDPGLDARTTNDLKSYAAKPPRSISSSTHI